MYSRVRGKSDSDEPLVDCDYSDTSVKVWRVLALHKRFSSQYPFGFSSYNVISHIQAH